MLSVEILKKKFFGRHKIFINGHFLIALRKKAKCGFFNCVKNVSLCHVKVDLFIAQKVDT